MDNQSTLALAIFATVYLGMILGGLPWLHLDRTGVALLGAIALIGAGVLSVEEAARAVHLPTVLLLPVAEGSHAGPTLALVSTFAGNLLIAGSIANVIVVDASRRYGISIDWKRHARTGVPVTLVTLAITAGWLSWRTALT